MLTVPVSSTLSTLLRASQASNNEISFTKALISFGVEVARLSRESFAFTHGWDETVMFAGNGDMANFEDIN